MFEGYLKLHGAPVGSSSTLPGFMQPNPNAWRVYISAVARYLSVGGRYWLVSAQVRNLLCSSYITVCLWSLPRCSLPLCAGSLSACCCPVLGVPRHIASSPPDCRASLVTAA